MKSDVEMRAAVGEIVGQLRPEELILLDSYDPDVRPPKTSGGPLGIGVTLAVTLLTPIVWKIVDGLCGDILKELSRKAAAEIVALVSARFQSKDPAVIKAKIVDYAAAELETSDLTPAQKAEISDRIAAVLLAKFRVSSS